jgi:hypothetical protein
MRISGALCTRHKRKDFSILVTRSQTLTAGISRFTGKGKTMYNGWSNYETWRVNLEIFDGYEWEGENYTNTYELSKCLEQYADDAITNFGEITEGLAIDSRKERRITNV